MSVSKLMSRLRRGGGRSTSGDDSPPPAYHSVETHEHPVQPLKPVCYYIKFVMKVEGPVKRKSIPPMIEMIVCCAVVDVLHGRPELALMIPYVSNHLSRDVSRLNVIQMRGASSTLALMSSQSEIRGYTPVSVVHSDTTPNIYQTEREINIETKEGEVATIRYQIKIDIRAVDHSMRETLRSHGFSCTLPPSDSINEIVKRILEAQHTNTDFDISSAVSISMGKKIKALKPKKGRLVAANSHPNSVDFQRWDFHQ